MKTKRKIKNYNIFLIKFFGFISKHKLNKKKNNCQLRHIKNLFFTEIFDYDLMFVAMINIIQN